MNESSFKQKHIPIALATACFTLALVLGLRSWSGKPENQSGAGKNPDQELNHSFTPSDRKAVRHRQGQPALNAFELETQLLDELSRLEIEDFQNEQVKSELLLMNPDSLASRPDYLIAFLNLLDRTNQDNLNGLLAVLESPHIKNLPERLKFLIARLSYRKRGEFISDFNPIDNEPMSNAGLYELSARAFIFEGFATSNQEAAMEFLANQNRPGANSSYSAVMTEVLAKDDPFAAIDYISSLESSRSQRAAVESLTRVLYSENGPEPEIWLSQLQDPNLVRASQKTVETLINRGLLVLE